MRRMTSISTLLVASLLWVTPLGAQTTVTLNALKDNTLYEDPAGAFGNGSGEHFFAGRTNLLGGGIIRRGLIAFDVAGTVPAGAFILDARLILFMSQTTAGPQPVDLHRVLADWAEGTANAPGGEGSGAARIDPEATWIHTVSPLSLWATAGGDFDPGVSGSLSVNAVGSYTWNSGGMVADVQSWLDNPVSNFGWLLRGREDTLATAKRFSSKTDTTLANRPTLEITYVVPTVVELPASQDNTLYEDALGALSNGRGQHMFAGRNGLLGGMLRHRAVVQFDVPAAVPSGAVILGAYLNLFMSKTIALTMNVGAHRLRSAWGEGVSDALLEEGQGAPAAPGDATWLHTFFPGSLWAAAGGFFNLAPSAVIPVNQIGAYVWSGSGMVTDVQDMLDTPANNFGWLIHGDETTGSTSKRFSTKEDTTLANRPGLRVFYYVPAPACLVTLSGDVNNNGQITTADIIALVNYVLKSGALPVPCIAAGDINCNGQVTTADIIALVNYVLKSGLPPCDVCTIIPAMWSCP